MLGRLISRHAGNRGDSAAVVHAGNVFSYAELEQLARSLAAVPGLREGIRVGVVIESPSRLIAALAALDRVGAKAFLLGPRGGEEIERLTASLGLDTVWRDHTPATPAASRQVDATGTVTMLTSGTTGEPKAIEHTWETLARPVRCDETQREARWLCAYPLQLYAGTQVLLQALVNGAAVVVPETYEAAAIARLLVQADVTHASGTPTFWRQICLFGGRALLREARIKQITLGGEAVPQELLDTLSSTFANPRIVHIYASTELGKLFSVTDGMAGFPATYLDKVPGGNVALEIREGELYAQSANAMVGCSGWVATGDLVEHIGDRILFRGRRTEVINVGGFKVSPIKVETALRDVPGVADLRVYAKRSSLAGQLVACDVVAAKGSERDAVKGALLDAARSTLSPAERPRIVKFVERIDLTSAFKVARGETDG